MSKPLTLYYYKEKGELKFYPHQEILFNAFVSKLKEGDTVEIKVKKQGRQKTRRQLAYWYGVLLPHTVQALLDAGHNTVCDASIFGFSVPIKADKDSVDWMLKSMFQAHKMLSHRVKKTEMTTEEMSELIDFALAWAAENLGVFIPTPKEQGDE